MKIVRWKYVYEYQLINWIKNKFSMAFSKTLFKRFLFFFLNSIEQNRKPLNSFLFIYLTVINWWECQTKETWAIESSSYSACSTNRHENSRIWLYYDDNKTYTPIFAANLNNMGSNSTLACSVFTEVYSLWWLRTMIFIFRLDCISSLCSLCVCYMLNRFL